MEEGKLVSEDHPDNPKEDNAGEYMEEELLFERQGINVGKSAPQTEREDHPDNPDEENAGEDMEEELPYEGEGIDVGEGAPQTERDDHTDNPDEENAGEEADEEEGNEQSQSKSTVCRLLQEINQCYSLEETEPSKIQNHCLLIPKVEETSESKKEPDYEKATTVSSESLNPHPFARMKKTDKLAATSSASVTTGVPYEDLLVKVAERKTSRLQNRANHPPPRYEKNRIPLLSQNLRSPFEPGTQVKGGLNRYAKLYTLTELEEVVYGKVAESKVAELTFFMSRK